MFGTILRIQSSKSEVLAHKRAPQNYKSRSYVMKTIYHREEHFKGGNTIRDIVIGMSDGLTVPFALAAGISGAIAETHLVVTAGFAEIAAGSIAMGLGGYLAARSDAEHFETEAKLSLYSDLGFTYTAPS